MTKENLLFGVVGLLIGLIVGFVFTNSINQRMATGSAVTQNANTLPPGHPDIGDTSGAPSGGGMQPEVQAAIEEAKKQPDNFDAQLKVAEFYYQIKRFDGALEYLRKANQLKPDNYEVIGHLGNANFDGDHYQEAEKWYTAALAKKPDDINVRTDLGLTFIFRDPPNYDRAIQEFLRSLETDPNHVQTLQNL